MGNFSSRVYLINYVNFARKQLFENNFSASARKNNKADVPSEEEKFLDNYGTMMGVAIKPGHRLRIENESAYHGELFINNY